MPSSDLPRLRAPTRPWLLCAALALVARGGATCRAFEVGAFEVGAFGVGALGGEALGVGAFGVGALAIAVPTPAFAQSAADRAEAKRVYAEARKALADGKLDEAVGLFRKAHVLAPTPVTRLDLARVLVQKGLLVEARALARSVAELPVSPTETAKSQLARTDAAALAAELDRRVPTVELVIVAPSSDPSATPSVTLDGAALSASALAAPLAVDPGEHLLSVRLGDAVVDARVAVAEGDHKTVTLTLPQPAAPSRPDPPPPQVDPPPPPLLPPATPAPDPRVPAGVGAQPGFVAQGLGGPATRADETAGDPLAPTAAVLLGLGLSSLVAGAISGGLALSQATGLLAECVASACPPSQADALTTHQATATAATALFAIGGVVTAAGGVVLVIYVTSDDDAKPEAGGPRVSLGWAGTGLELRGAW